jgi:hypothetical protein
MGVELSKAGGGQEEPPRPAAPQRPREREIEVIRPEDLEPPLGANLPVIGWISDAQFQVFRFVGLGGWIVLFAILPGVFWWVGFLAMWAWIGANVAYEKDAHRRRRLRAHYRRAVKLGLAVPGTPEPELRRSRVPRSLAAPPRAVAPPPDPRPPILPYEPVGPRQQSAPPVTSVPQVTVAERALVAVVRRVDTSDRFERTDVILVHEVSDLLGPLLLRIAERGGDPQVRHDLETLATDHLPRTVDDFLSLPADVARESRNASGTTPAEELRSQLHLLVEGCRQLRDSVHAADVDRQQQQSRFLETKFRKSDLDL